MKPVTVFAVILGIVILYLTSMPYVAWIFKHTPLDDSDAAYQVYASTYLPVFFLSQIVPVYGDFLDVQFTFLDIDQD